MLVGSLWRRSRMIAYRNASTAPAITAISSTGRVQFSKPNGLRSFTGPPAVSHENPSRVASSAKVDEHISDICGPLCRLLVGCRVPAGHVVAGVVAVEPLACQGG